MGTEFLEIILTVKMAPGTKAALFKTAQAGAEQRPETGQLRRLAQSLKERPKQPVFWKSIWLRTSLEIVVQSRPRVLPISLKEAEASSRVLIVKRSSKDKCLCLFIVVSSFISAAQEDDTLKNVRLKSTLSFVRITSMAKRRRGGI